MKGLPTPPHPCQIAGSGAELAPSYRERDDNYYAVIAQLSPRWRIIVPTDGIQWIIQRREASHAAPWRGVGYVQRREGLITLCGRLGLILDAPTLAGLEALPARSSDYWPVAQSN